MADSAALRRALVYATGALVSGATLVTERMVEGSPLLTRRSEQNGPVAIIVPMRDEARNAARAAGTLLDAAAAYGDARLIVVNDGSTDGTGQILDALQRDHPHGARLQVLTLEEALPEGWLGKPRACWAGAQVAAAREAEWLLFVDADTTSTPDLVGRLVAEATASGSDLVSIFPHQALGSVSERLVMPHLFYALAVAFPWQSVNDPQSPIAIANGQCVLMRRSVYDRVDGHRAVRGAIAEDQALAEVVKSAGYRLRLTDGRDVMVTRMYTSLAELFEGWSKNAYRGLGDRAWLLLVAIFFGMIAGVAPFLGLPLALRRRRWREALVWGVTLAVVLRNRARAAREFQIPQAYALTLPVGVILCSAIGVAGWWRVESGAGVTWKGRRYDLNGTD